jgi:membrane protein YdbS with pleckstrin-like domain
MVGILRLMVAFCLLIAAAYGVIYLWTGALPEHGLKVLATVGIVTVLSLAITILSRPAGGNKGS